MTCPKCSTENLVDAKYCEKCGAPLSEELPSILHEETLTEKVLELKDKLKDAFDIKNYREVLKDKRSPATNMLIVFIAWGILNFIGMRPLLILLRIIAFMLGPFGLVLLLGITYIYSVHREDIERRLRELRGESKDEEG